MVLTTGNKSEMSVGYATLYGDMCGGYSVLKDVYKTTVFALCRWRNAHRPEGCLAPAGELIPSRVIDKPPTAELRADQKDEDSLPPYAVLDRILDGLVEQDLSPRELVAQGFDARDGAAGVEPARPRRIQAPAGAAGGEDHEEGVRARPALPDHQRVPPGRAQGSAGRAIEASPGGMEAALCAHPGRPLYLRPLYSGCWALAAGDAGAMGVEPG